MAYLSPGVFVQEIDASTIAPTVSNSICVFGGDFYMGPVGTYTIITSVADLITYYGEPSNTNYNDWYQAYNFLQYGNKLLLSRASNVTGVATAISGTTFTAFGTTDDIATLSTVANVTVGEHITFGTQTDVYEIVSIDTQSIAITVDRLITTAPNASDPVNSWAQAMNGVVEAVDSSATTSTAGNDSTIGAYSIDVPNPAVANTYDYVASLMPIQNATDFQTIETSLTFADVSTGKLKIWARSPGAWSSDIQICIASPSSFLANSTTPSTHVTRYAFPGLVVDDLFQYAPTGTQVGIVVYDGTNILETWTVDFTVGAKDNNNKSTYIEDVINYQSSYIFVKDNTSDTTTIADYTLAYDTTTSGYLGSTLKFSYSTDSVIDASDLLNAYDIFSNKEELDIDIVIANELDAGVSAKTLVDAREDCIGFIGANYGDVVGQKSATAVSNLITWRQTGSLNYDDMFLVACGNYKYQYDRYNDKYRWVNIAGDIAGLRAQTSMNRASWWASAGLERGQVKNAIKLAFNPTQGQRDLLYKAGINPVVAFPGQGTVMWGQKTLLSQPSSFDRVNVRGLFNTVERSLSKMAKYQVMEFNDNFTRNRIVSMIKPYLTTVQSGRGIQDFLVICDESNNTPDIISRNELIVDVYIKPTYVAEFIILRFTNAGTNSFASIIGG